MSKVFIEPRHAGEFILSEANGHRSRENVIVAAEQAIEAGTILAFLAVVAGVTATVIAGAENAGNGTLTMAGTPVSSKAKNGTYVVIATSDTTFAVEDPKGVNIGNATVGTAFNKEVKFTIAAGGTAFAAGDRFEVIVGVEAGDYQAVAYNPDGDDGSEKPAAIAIYPALTGEGETVKIAALRRDAEVNTHCLAWPEEIVAEKKAAAISALAALGIIVR